MSATYFQKFTRDDQETEIEVEYSISGGCPAHMGSLTYPGHPAEAPEVEIVKAWEVASEKNITLTAEEDERMCQWIIENHEDDGPDPDDWYDARRDDEMMERARDERGGE